MPDNIGWAQRVADQAEIILAHKGNAMPDELLTFCGDRIVWFGTDTENHDLIHYFLKKQELEV
jgi:hypothetical protein